MSINKKIVRFTNLCATSRHIGLSKEEHAEKIGLADELVEDGLMIKSTGGSFEFVNQSDSDYFSETINNFKPKKTARMSFSSIKDEAWSELAYDLLFDKFKSEHPDLDEEEVNDKFYTEVVSKRFKYGEFGSFDIIVDEDFNIVGGKIHY